MSVSVDVEVPNLSPEGRSDAINHASKSSSEGQDALENVEAGQGDKNDGLETPKLHPMAFTVNFGEGNKRFDNKRLEELAKKSQARHQRVQSMSASLTRSTPPQKPPMSAKLPRKAQGYNSEGYFSSDQEDSGVSGSVKLRNSPLAQERTHSNSPASNRHIKSPVNDSFQPQKMSKSPIVDSIMSRSDNFVSRQGLILPLKGANCSYLRDVHKTPSYGNLSASYQPKSVMADIIDKSPEGVLLTDISSPELDILTPDNGLSTPEMIKSPIHKMRAMSETPDLLFQKCNPKLETLYIDDDIDRESNSSTGTYTIEGDNYTEEQKARMSIDRTIASKNNVSNTSLGSKEKDPELIFDFQLQNPKVITKEPIIESIKSPVTKHLLDSPTNVAKDKNVLEISCCYESPTENDLAAQTSKQIKSTRNYLEKIKNRVRTITEKTFAKSPPKIHDDGDFGCFTSVTTSGVLSTKSAPKTELPTRRRCSLSKSEIDKTDYIHRLSRESSVPVSLPSNKPLPLENAQFESTAMKNAHKILREENESPEIDKLSHMSLNRCKGDKTWIQEWADSVKRYNRNTLASSDSYVIDSDRPPLSPRHIPKPRSPHGVAASKIPSPVGTLLHRRTPDLIPVQDTESYLQKTQNAISNLQAKLHSSRTSNLCNIPPQLTSSLISEKSAASKLPVSQLCRSNSLNYRLRRKDTSTDNSPLRSPGHYVITGSTKLPESTKILLNSASKSLDADRRKDHNMNSPNSDRDISNSSDDKTLSNRHYDVDAILSPHRKTHTRHKSFDGRTNINYFTNDQHNANQAVCLKTVLKNNAIETNYPRIEQTRCQDTKKSHQRVFSEGNKQLRPLHPSNSIAFGMAIRRSSSFNTVNKNNNYIEPQRIISRRSSGQSEECRTDYLSDDSDNVSYDKSQDIRYKKLYKGRVDSPDLKSVAPANSPSRRCPNTPEMQRKFGPGLVRNSVRVTNKERAANSRLSEPPMGREERSKQTNHQSRKAAEPSKQTVFSRLTKSRSSTREVQPKIQEKVTKKPSQHRSSSALASKEVEFSNWKKRASYDPMKAAREGRKKQVVKRRDCKDDLSSPSHSSPVHRSQSFHTTNIADLEILDYSSEDIEDEQVLSRLPMDPMLSSTHSCDVVFTRDYVAGFKVNQTQPQTKRLPADKRRTFIMDDDVTPTKENIDFLSKCDIDKRKTFILDSDTNSTTNGSSPRNSTHLSHGKASLTGASDTEEGDSGTEHVVMRSANRNSRNHRHSGDYSMSSSTTSIHKKPTKADILPRYMDISKYKSENSPKNFLRRDPSKTYVNVLEKAVSKGSAQHYEMEQKKQELEKWKRRASYDPRKAAAQGNKTTKTASAVSRSASFHAGVQASQHVLYDGNSDNDF